MAFSSYVKFIPLANAGEPRVGESARGAAELLPLECLPVCAQFRLPAYVSDTTTIPDNPSFLSAAAARLSRQYTPHEVVAYDSRQL